MLGRWAVVVHDDLALVWEFFFEEVGCGEDSWLVLVADYQQRWGADVVEAVGGGRLWLPFFAQAGIFVLQGDQVHLADQVPDGGGDIFGGSRGPVDPHPDLQLGDSLQVSGLVGGDELVPLFGGPKSGLNPPRADPTRTRLPTLSG